MKETPMRYLNPLALLLVIVGGINWLLVGLFQFDLRRGQPNLGGHLRPRRRQRDRVAAGPRPLADGPRGGRPCVGSSRWASPPCLSLRWRPRPPPEARVRRSSTPPSRPTPRPASSIT